MKTCLYPYYKIKLKYIDLLYNEWLLQRNMIVDDVNIIRELIDVHEIYKSINVLIMCDVDFMIESMCIN